MSNPKLNWKQWKMGAVVSIFLSLFVAMTGVAAGMKWQAFIAVLGAALVTHFGAYLKDHPVTEINFETASIRKEENDKSNVV